jgi:MFS family permease
MAVVQRWIQHWFATPGQRWYTATVVTTYLQRFRLFHRDVRLFLVSAALVGLAWDGMRAVLLNLYLLRLGYGPDFVGLVNAVGALSFALLCLPAGTLGLRWGSSNTLLAGTSLMAAGFWLWPVAEFLGGAWRTGWLLTTSVVIFLGLALYLVNGLPFLMDRTGPEDRSHAFSVHMALIPLTAFLGSLIGGALPGVFAALLGVSLEEAAPFRFPLWLAALVLLPAVWALLSVRSTDRASGRPSLASAPDTLPTRAPYGLIIAIALIMALRFGGRGATTTFFNVYLDQGLSVPPVLIGVLTATGQLLSVPAALAAPVLVARWGNPRTIFWGTIGMALSTLPLALVPHWAMAGVGFVSSAIWFSTTVGPIRVFSQELVAPRWRSTMASGFMLGAGLAFAAISLVGGYAIVALGYRTLFLVAAGLTAAGGIFFGLYFRKPRGLLAEASVTSPTESPTLNQGHPPDPGISL